MVTHASEIDPFTFQIVRHKLFRVTEEAIIALESVSGTPITAEAHDLMVSVYRADGSLMVGGVGFLQHMTSASQAVKHIISAYSEDPGIFEGDVFLLNDPYTGALHASDTYLIAPIHWEGELVGFVAAFLHIADIGGIEPGGFCPSATSCFQEGFATRGLKVIERGKVRRDVFETLLNVVRDPGMVGLDLRSLIAACNVARDRMVGLYADYGYETVDRIGAELIDQTEGLLRARLSELPDGVWRSRQYYEQAAGLARVELAAIKQGDRLTIDLTGTSEQSPQGINCSYWATWGSIYAPILPVLAWDMVWNDGLFKTVELVAPEGSLVNARRPAPVSLATVGTVQLIRNAMLHVLSKMVGASETLHRRGVGTWAPTIMHYTLAGTSPDGNTVSHHGTDTFVGAGGARSYRDGIDLGGVFHAPANRCANVERHEVSFPHRYLYRRIVPDSGGPGKYRGGACHEFAVVPHGGGGDGFTAVVMPGRGVNAPMSQGLFGGYPGCNTASTQFRDANLGELPYDEESTASAAEEHVGVGVTRIEPGDAQYMRYDGGGGYGDPLDRDPRSVLADVAGGLVSRPAAAEVYGVAIVADSIDAAATQRLRLAIRAERLGVDAAGLRPETEVEPSGRRLAEYLQVTGELEGARIQCGFCGQGICDAGERWKDNVPFRRSRPSRFGPQRSDTGEFQLLEFFCPGCGTVLDVETVHADDGPLHDEIRSWPLPMTELAVDTVANGIRNGECP